jgi:formate-dependent nitrite reductase membrane component NrfD
MMDEAVWGWPLIVDLWAAGVAGGGFFAAFLVDRFTGRQNRQLIQVATWVGVPLVLLGVLLLVVDLGNQLRFWHLMVRLVPLSLTFLPRSPMSIGTWVLSAWSVCGVILIVLWLAERRVPGFVVLERFVPLAEILIWVNLALSISVITYTGVVLSNTNVPMWTTVFLPALFVSSAVFTGTAAIQLVSTLWGKAVPREFGRANLILAGIQMAALIAFLVTVPAHVLVGGSLAVWFWVGAVLIGMIVPFALDLWTLRVQRTMPFVLSSTLCVLVGGLVLRAMVLLGGQV